ncbi:extensin family protein [Ancylobacter sp. G4_0304]|uniref:extensin-like domain-containing protein n=1 Tax=Ancylobacter sp. G4_0304 TaxID=3114289 RepID=UPI0039C71BE5
MARGVSWFFVAPLVLLGLSGCKFGLEQREPWRSAAEQRCLAEGLVKPSAYIQPMRAIDGAGTCGMDHPFKISAFGNGSVEVAPKATLACPMTSAVDRWIEQDIQPAAMAWFGQPVAKVKQMSSYSCRKMNGAKTGKTSEHAFGNGLDIGGFVLADGREISVQSGWKGRPDEAGFLRTVQASACQRFTVVLAPGSNIYHYNHIHVDLMRRASRSTTCKPAPVVPRPPNLPIYKAPPMRGYPGSMVSTPGPVNEVEPAYDEEGEPVSSNAPVSAPAQARAQPYPAQPYPAQAYPAAASAYPAPAGGAVGAPIQLSPGYGQPAYGQPSNHGVDPNYRPQPSAAPLSPYPATSDYPAAPSYPAPAYPGEGYPAQGYPAQGYPAQPAPVPAAAPAQQTRPRPPGVPLPPAGIPLAKWLGLDRTSTGSTGNVRSFTDERQFASPIAAPEAPAGED